MPFIKPDYTNTKDYLQDVQNDVLIPWLAVHDEEDFIVDGKMMVGIMKRITRIGHCKRELSKLSSLPYINFLFDTEYDPWGSWTAKSKIEDTTSLAKDELEDYWKTKYNELIAKVKKEQTVATEIVSNTISEDEVLVEPDLKNNIVEIKSKDVLKLLMKIIDTLPDGETEIRFLLGERTIVGKRKVDLTTMAEAFLKL